MNHEPNGLREVERIITPLALKLKGFCQGKSKWKALRESQTKSRPKLKAKEKGLEKEYEGPLLTKQGNSFKCLVLLMMNHATSSI
jgi:hypothetical protein